MRHTRQVGKRRGVLGIQCAVFVLHRGKQRGATLFPMDDSRPAELGTQRDPPPYFAGRGDELAALRKRLRRLCETGDPRSGMSLIIGVPGVGKTQLGREFAERAAAHEAPAKVRQLEVDSVLLESEVDLFLDMGRALEAEDEFRKTADLHSKSTGRNLGVGAIKGGRTQEHVRHTGNLPALLSASKSAGAWDGQALVIVVDELQTIDPAGMKALRVLHQGAHGCPMLVLGIGLQHTPQVLANPRDGSAGISRVAQTIHLGALPAAEAWEAINGNMQALGHELPEPCVSALAEASCGFPQHVHGYLEGAVQAIAKHGELASGAALDDALALGDGARRDYYESRLSMLANQNAMLPVVQAMREQNRDVLRQEEAVQAIDDASFNGEETVRQAIAHGVLTLESGGVSFGIPSFHGHMDNLLRERQLEAGLSGKSDGGMAM